MKKTVAFIMFLCLFVGLLAGCGSEKKSSTGSKEGGKAFLNEHYYCDIFVKTLAQNSF